MCGGGCWGGWYGARVEPSMGLRCSLEEGSLGWMQGQVWNLGILGADGG